MRNCSQVLDNFGESAQHLSLDHKRDSTFLNGVVPVSVCGEVWGLGRGTYKNPHLWSLSNKGQTNITGVCGECSQCLGHTGFAPAHSVCAFPVCTAQALGCSAGKCLRQALG